MRLCFAGDIPWAPRKLAARSGHALLTITLWTATEWKKRECPFQRAVRAMPRATSSMQMSAGSGARVSRVPVPVLSD